MFTPVLKGKVGVPFFCHLCNLVSLHATPVTGKKSFLQNLSKIIENCLKMFKKLESLSYNYGTFDVFSSWFLPTFSTHPCAHVWGTPFQKRYLLERIWNLIQIQNVLYVVFSRAARCSNQLQHKSFKVQLCLKEEKCVFAKSARFFKKQNLAAQFSIFVAKRDFVGKDRSSRYSKERSRHAKERSRYAKEKSRYAKEKSRYAKGSREKLR